VKAPVIVMYGTGDFVTSEEESAALVSRINAGGKADQAKLVVLPMDHGFMAHETPERAWRAEQGIIPPAGLYKRVVDSIESFATETQRR
jgi:dienelactone hydrolase